MNATVVSFPGKDRGGQKNTTMQIQKFSLKKRAKSFHFAFNGFYQFFATQHNAVIHAAATGLVVALSLLVKLPLSKFLFVITAIGLVWIAELFNTAIEQLCDMVCPRQHPQIKFIKDVSAAAVLVAALMAVITACIIFIPVLL
jgi:diacylglycerol kinase (ATP)